MKRNYNSARLTRRSFTAAAGAAIVAGTAPFNIVRAQGAALKVGVLLPRSGVRIYGVSINTLSIPCPVPRTSSP